MSKPRTPRQCAKDPRSRYSVGWTDPRAQYVPMPLGCKSAARLSIARLRLARALVVGGGVLAFSNLFAPQSALQPALTIAAAAFVIAGAILLAYDIWLERHDP